MERYLNQLLMMGLMFQYIFNLQDINPATGYTRFGTSDKRLNKQS